jgi:BMFP domain-containing protein YqiC
MQQKSSPRGHNSPLHAWHEELTRHLLAILEKDGGARRNVAHIVETVYVDQTRAPWPGSYLSPAKKLGFHKWLQKNAQILSHIKDSSVLVEFVSKVSSRLLRELSAAQISSTVMDQESGRRAQIEHLIKQEMSRGLSTEDTVSRSVQRYVKENARTKRYQEEIHAPENDPLRDLLGLPRIGRTLLPKEDIRVHMARFVVKSKLPLALVQQSKTPDLLLGEFANRCKFVGFADKQHLIVLLDVSSPLVAQELMFSKTAILKRLRQSPELAQVVDVRFRVKPGG